MPEKSLSQLIETSLLISPEMKEQLATKIPTFTEAQQQEMMTAILQSEEELKHILTDALKQDAERLSRIQKKLDDVWIQYLKTIESVSRSQEEGEREAMIKKLDE